MFCALWIQCHLTYFIFTAVNGTLVLTPPRLVVEHGTKASAVCSTNMTIESMAWEASQGSMDITSGVQQLTWTVPHIKEWDIKPLCFVNFKEGSKPQRVNLPVTVYKVPEKVSVTVVNHTGAMTEGKNYWLQCNIQNVAPVQKVIVNWYKERTLMKRDNETSEETAKEPQNKAAILQISADRTDYGAQYRCESELELGADGPQPAPRVISEPLSITVHYSPQFSSSVEFIEQKDQVILNCTVTANPPPEYSWYSPQLTDTTSRTSELTLPTQSVGNYSCTASNLYGSDTKLFIITKTGRSPTLSWIIIGTVAVLATFALVWVVVRVARPV